MAYQKGRIEKVVSYIRENDILEYADLLDTLADNQMTELWEIAADNTLEVDAYITSRRRRAGGRQEEL